jgi:hypothetical protein
MARQSKPNDFTGRQREALAEQFIEEQQNRANEMSMATAEAQIKLETEVLDATKPNRPVTVVVDEVKRLAKDGEETVVIRTVDTIESMTFGAGNTYSFKAGQKYSVTKEVAAHLKEKGYLANVL